MMDDLHGQSIGASGLESSGPLAVELCLRSGLQAVVDQYPLWESSSSQSLHIPSGLCFRSMTSRHAGVLGSGRAG